MSGVFRSVFLFRCSLCCCKDQDQSDSAEGSETQSQVNTGVRDRIRNESLRGTGQRLLRRVGRVQRNNTCEINCELQL